MAEIGEKCAVFGIYGKNIDVSRLTFFGLFALQHRGQEATGIATNDGGHIVLHKGSGLVSQVFDEETIAGLTGHIALGHNRYSTSGSKDLKGAQPVYIEDVNIALVHNGNLPDTSALESFLTEHGTGSTDLNDSQMMAEAIAVYLREGKTLEESIKSAYPLFTGVFSLLLMNEHSLVAVRDSYGVRPLSMGSIGNAVVFSSETCAFHPTGTTFVRDIEPGEMVVVDENGTRSVRIEKGSTHLDLFEFVYFARPDSTLLGKSVYEVRKNLGVELARECSVDADVVIPVPDTSTPVALGYSNASGIPFEMGLMKNRYIHRTFIQPEQATRETSVKMKLTPMPEIIRGKKIILIDDSIVRGTTSRALVQMVYEAGAKEIYFLVSSPPVKYPDFYGIDTPKQEKLLAAQMSIEEMKNYLGVERLCFLSLEGTIRATDLPEQLFCTSCFTGIYPVDIGKKKEAIRNV